MHARTHLAMSFNGTINPGVQVASVRYADGRVATGAFVMPNSPIDAGRPVTDFAVPLAALEAAAGVQFFPDSVTVADGEVWGSASPLLPPPSPPPADGAPPAPAPALQTHLHLCTAVTCELPPERLWGKDSSSRSSSGGESAT